MAITKVHLVIYYPLSLAKIQVEGSIGGVCKAPQTVNQTNVMLDN